MTPADAAWQVLADCPHCRTESAVVEVYDPAVPACWFGVPVERRCRLCGWTEGVDAAAGAPAVCPACTSPVELGTPRCEQCGFAPTRVQCVPPADLSSPASARAALARWAAEDGEAELAVFCAGSFGASPEEVIAKLVARQPVTTLFDVIAFLFPTASAPATGPALRLAERAHPTAPPTSAAAGPRAARGSDDREPDPRLAARVLASVMVADGALRSVERAFVDAHLARIGALPLDPADAHRVWRPHELGPTPAPAVRDALLEAAVHLAHADGVRDDSEWRVIRTYARAWGCPEARLDAWDNRYRLRYGSWLRRLLG